MNFVIKSRVGVWMMAAGALAALPVMAAEPKIGVVDFQRLAIESPQGKAVMESMRAEFAPRERTLQAQGQAMKAKEEKLQKDGATMSEDQRARAEKELRDGARDFERAKGEFQDDMNARRNEELSRLQRTIVEEVRTYGKAQGYDLILAQEGVIYNASASDITPAVLSALTARGGTTTAAKPAATPPAAPPAKPPTK
ncbi:MAG TPA: OmpH family outer membrane protein [Steroidobacteraceae bacterium]|nr:OmpH family outer membrane protein [Steroidobacteraceae bacterium]